MAKGGARTSGRHNIAAAPSTAGQREARPASTSDADNGAAHPTSRKPNSGGGHGNGNGNGANK